LFYNSSSALFVRSPRVVHPVGIKMTYVKDEKTGLTTRKIGVVFGGKAAAGLGVEGEAFFIFNKKTGIDPVGL
jgi:hypothetical protein